MFGKIGTDKGGRLALPRNRRVARSWAEWRAALAAARST
jgi:hypothetical protein